MGVTCSGQGLRLKHFSASGWPQCSLYPTRRYPGLRTRMRITRSVCGLRLRRSAIASPQCTPLPIRSKRCAAHAAIVVGGGNTFHLLAKLYAAGLVELIAERVRAGVPYIGWSAGSVIACPRSRTTNDMPIVEPPSLMRLGPRAVPDQRALHGGCLDRGIAARPATSGSPNF